MPTKIAKKIKTKTLFKKISQYTSKYTAIAYQARKYLGYIICGIIIVVKILNFSNGIK